MERTEVFTGNATDWIAGSLVGAVPAGATDAVLSFTNTSDNPLVLHLRKTGSSEDKQYEIQPSLTTGMIWMALTSARTVEYKVSNGAISCDVLTYVAGSLASGTTYTTATTLAGFLRLYDASSQARFVPGASTDPLLSEMNNLINQAEDFIDRETNHAWRAVTVTNEYHDIQPMYDGTYRRELPVKLNRRSIRAMVSGTDKIEYWNGSSWIEMVATKTEGRANDYWVDYTNGIVYFIETKPQYYVRGVRFTYRYGESTVPKDIELAATMLAALSIVTNDEYKNVLPEGVREVMTTQRIDMWQKRIDRILDNHREMVWA